MGDRFRVREGYLSLIRHARLIDLACVFLFLAFSAFGYIKYRRIADHLAAAQGHLSQIQSMSRAHAPAALQLEGLQAIEGELIRAETELGIVRDELGPLLALSPYLSWLPLVGGDLKAAPHLLDLTMDCLEAGRLICRGAQPAASLLAGRSPGIFLTQGFDDRILTALVDERPTFLTARARLDNAATYRQEIDQTALSPGLRRRLVQLDHYLPLFQAGAQMALLAPDVAPGLLGLDSPKTYLVLAQNNHELRATGGFISAVGLVRMDRGRVSTTGFRDSYLFDDPARPYSSPPKALTRTMRAGVWVLRDANWSPDFPTTARVAGEMYQLTQGVAVDGVLAIDLTATEYILGAIGPLHVAAYGEEVSRENLADKLKSYWTSPGQEGDWWSHRKDFLAALAESVFTRLETGLDHRQVVNLLLALWKSLEEKHLLIYADDPEVERFLAENNWDGAIRSIEGDYLFVVDTNVGYNKVDPKVERALDYQVVIGDDGHAHGRVTVSYTNTSSAEVDRCLQEAKYQSSYDQMMEGCYWDYLRLYVPEGSHITEATVVPWPQGSLLSQAGESSSDDGRPTLEPPERGKAVFSQFFVVAPGQRQEISFQYDLPLGTLQEEGGGRYQLLVQKQPGTLAVPVHLAVTLPARARLIAARPRATRVLINVAEFETVLSTDQRFELIWR